ncbi:uncharacterized protein Mb2253c-like [Telopea speciosissima]|uniref:uncharacterized protein Mb2253c-like n=1 Tax=Telopea speciosissima TaxID=54955 RepID=UPI001CC54EC5|nr:uncharacterized protein Mb2253c-like [Telopea speciosissima]
MDPIKYLFEKPSLIGRMVRWLLLLSEFDITYVNQKSIKGRAISDHLVAHPTTSDSRPVEDLFPDEELCLVRESKEAGWQLYFDGVANQKEYGAGVLLVTPDGSHLPMSFRLEFSCTNNIAEYKACAIGLEMALSKGAERIKVFGDSSVVICQTQGKWKTRHDELKPYQEYLEQMIRCFKKISFEYLPKDNNRFVDALATLASMLEYNSQAKI